MPTSFKKNPSVAWNCVAHSWWEWNRYVGWIPCRGQIYVQAIAWWNTRNSDDSLVPWKGPLVFLKGWNLQEHQLRSWKVQRMMMTYFIDLTAFGASLAKLDVKREFYKLSWCIFLLCIAIESEIQKNYQQGRRKSMKSTMQVGTI